MRKRGCVDHQLVSGRGAPAQPAGGTAAPRRAANASSHRADDRRSAPLLRLSSSVEVSHRVELRRSRWRVRPALAIVSRGCQSPLRPSGPRGPPRLSGSADPPAAGPGRWTTRRSPVVKARASLRNHRPYGGRPAAAPRTAGGSRDEGDPPTLAICRSVGRQSACLPTVCHPMARSRSAATSRRGGTVLPRPIAPPGGRASCRAVVAASAVVGRPIHPRRGRSNETDRMGCIRLLV